jgi:hypothetical protein
MEPKSFRVRQIQIWSAESLVGRAGSLVGCAEIEANALEEISSGLKANLARRKPILFSGRSARR